MKVYAARRNRSEGEIDYDKQIKDVSKLKLDKNIRETCKSAQAVIQKKFPECEVTVQFSNALDTYFITINIGWKLKCEIRPLQSYSYLKFEGPLDSENLSVITRLTKFVNSDISKLLEGGPTSSSRNTKSKLEFQKRLQILKKYSSDPSIWVGNYKGSTYYRVHPEDPNYYQSATRHRNQDGTYGFSLDHGYSNYNYRISEDNLYREFKNGLDWGFKSLDPNNIATSEDLGIEE